MLRHPYGLAVFLLCLVPVALLGQATAPRVLPAGTVGTAYSSGVLEALVSSCNVSGTLPPGLNCVFVYNPTGTYGLAVQGTPNTAGTYLFRLNGPQGTQYSLTINLPPPRVLTAATVGTAYDSGVLEPAGSGCKTTGNFPPGLNCYAASVATSAASGGLGLRGTPTQQGTFVFGLSSGSNLQYSLTVNPNTTSTPFIPDQTNVTATAASNGQPQTIPIKINTVGGVATPFVAGVSLTSPAATQWLTINQNSGVAPTTILATLNPARLAPGTYTGVIAISVASSAPRSKGPLEDGTTANITVTLTVPPQGLNFYYLIGGPAPVSKTAVVDSAGGANAQVSAFASVNTPSGGNWLKATLASTTAPTTLSVTVDPTGLAAGTYTGTVAVFVTGGTGSDIKTVTLTVTDSLALQLSTFTYTVGGTAPAPKTLTINNTSGSQINFITDLSTEGGNWLTVTPGNGSFPPGASDLTFSVSPAGMPAGTYRAICALVDPSKPAAADIVLVTLTISGGISRQVISHLTDGQGWKTSIILVNLDTVAAQFTLNFWKDDGSAYNVSVVGLGSRTSLTGAIPVGGSQTIETNGTAAELWGWAELLTSQNISGTAIFRASNGQEAAVPLLAAGSTRLLLPFDTSSGRSLGVALANTATAQDGAYSVTWRNQNGQMLATPSNKPLGAHDHDAFAVNNPSSQPADQTGVLEINSAASLYGLGIRFNGTPFTSVEALVQVAKGNRTITHIADGGGWKTTILLVNADTVPAPFGLRFWAEDGTALAVSIVGRGRTASITDTIPPGGSRIIETDGAGPLTVGWAQVATTQAVGGTAIFRTDTGQEAAVPLLATGSTRLLLPFDTNPGRFLGVALANPSTTTDITVAVTVRNEQGQQIATQSQTVKANGHAQFVFSNPSKNASDQRGVIELSSPGNPIFALGIRLNGQAWTSIKALGN